MGKEHAVAFVSNPRHKRGQLDLPAVLSTRMRTSAKTWSEVLYCPRLPFVPHSGFVAASSRRFNSACNSAVGISDQEEGAEEECQRTLCMCKQWPNLVLQDILLVRAS